jgi:hypothetical protein
MRERVDPADGRSSVAHGLRRNRLLCSCGSSGWLVLREMVSGGNSGRRSTGRLEGIRMGQARSPLGQSSREIHTGAMAHGPFFTP